MAAENQNENVATHLVKELLIEPATERLKDDMQRTVAKDNRMSKEPRVSKKIRDTLAVVK
jgi:hypothetical protein